MRLLNIVVRVGLREADLDVIGISHRRGGKARFCAEDEVLRPDVRHPAIFIQFERHRFKRLRDVDAERLEIRRHGRIGLRGLFYIVAAIGTAAQVRLLKLAIKLFRSLDIHRHFTPFVNFIFIISHAVFARKRKKQRRTALLFVALELCE